MYDNRKESCKREIGLCCYANNNVDSDGEKCTIGREGNKHDLPPIRDITMFIRRIA